MCAYPNKRRSSHFNGSFAKACHKQQIDTIHGWLPFLEYGRDEIFLRYIEKRIKTPLIPEELWEKAKHVTYTTYEKVKA